MTEEAVVLRSKNIPLGSRQGAKAGKLVSVRVLWWSIGLTFALIGVHLFFQYLNLIVYGEKHGLVFELSNRFDFDDESSLPTWVSQAVFLGIGLSALAAAGLERIKAKSKIWQILGIVAILISIDEILSLHETFLQYLHVMFFGDSASNAYANAWWFVLPLIIGAAGWLLVQIVRHFPKRTVQILAIGTIVYLMGAVAVDIVTNSAPKTTFWSQGIMVAIEESLELVGGILWLYAIVEYIETRYYKRIIKAFKELKS